MEKEYTYNWLHIPTGKTGTYTQTFTSYKNFLEELNNWNRIGKGVWQYYA